MLLGVAAPDIVFVTTAVTVLTAGEDSMMDGMARPPVEDASRIRLLSEWGGSLGSYGRYVAI